MKIVTGSVVATDTIKVRSRNAPQYVDGQTVEEFLRKYPLGREKALRALTGDHKLGLIAFVRP